MSTVTRKTFADASDGDIVRVFDISTLSDVEVELFNVAHDHDAVHVHYIVNGDLKAGTYDRAHALVFVTA